MINYKNKKEELIKPKEEKEEKSKVVEKKKRIIKKITYEDGSENEVEDVRHIQPKQNNKYMSMFENENCYFFGYSIWGESVLGILRPRP
jgi:hypothetical protein